METEHFFVPLFVVALGLGVTGVTVLPSWSVLFAALVVLSGLGIGVVAYSVYWHEP